MALLLGEPYDAIVAASGGSHTTIANAVSDGAKSIYVKAGESVAGATLSVADAELELGPGVTVTSSPAITGANNSIVASPGVDVQAEIDVTTGAEAYIEFKNGGDVDGFDINTARCYISGGGWGTVSDGGTSIAALDFASDDCMIEKCALQTTTGSTGEAAMDVTGARNVVRLCKVVDSEEMGMQLTGADSVVVGCTVIDADAAGLSCQAARLRIYANKVNACGGNALDTGANGDDCVMTGNVLDDTVTIHATGENSVVVGNRIDTTLTDSSGTSTTGSNDLTAF